MFIDEINLSLAELIRKYNEILLLLPHCIHLPAKLERLKKTAVEILPTFCLSLARIL
jgi:hypothetical protein